jgi:predicted transcriptional regulator
MAKKYLDGKIVDMTDAELATEVEWSKIRKADKDASKTEKENKATNETSAITKLKALGLTDDEIVAIRNA